MIFETHRNWVDGLSELSAFTTGKPEINTGRNEGYERLLFDTNPSRPSGT